MNLHSLRNRLLLSLLLGVIVFAGLTFYADYRDVGEALSDFRWELLPLILLLTSMNYVFRFVKWEYYLRIIGVKGLARRDSLLIFLSGLGMVITPGKVGEWLKCYLLREVHGTPIARSAPILLAERLTDSIALLLMASVGLFVFGDLWWVFVVVAGGAITLIAVARHRPTAHALLRFGGRLPLLRRFVPQLEELYESTYVVLSPRAVLEMSALSTLSWFFEVLAFYFTLVGVGQAGDIDLLLRSAFILPISTLALGGESAGLPTCRREQPDDAAARSRQAGRVERYGVAPLLHLFVRQERIDRIEADRERLCLVVHRDRNSGRELLHDRRRANGIDGKDAARGHEQHVDRPDRLDLLRRQHRLAEVAEVNDAQAACLVHEDRIATALGTFRIVVERGDARNPQGGRGALVDGGPGVGREATKELRVAAEIDVVVVGVFV